MELGNQIKALRQSRGVTQETLAQAIGVSAQAVSKWETAAALPDIALLPQLSAYFGVSIDELFALSDETRLERIQNMLWEQRELDPATVEREREFLLDLCRREPDSAQGWSLLADLELHLAEEHQGRAAEYAKAALERDPEIKGAHDTLVSAMNGRVADWCVANHHELIDWYQGFLEKNPTCRAGYFWLMDQLIDDFRFDEAEETLGQMEALEGDDFRTQLYRGVLEWYRGDREKAWATWEAMEMGQGKEWLKAFNMGDFLARAGEYGEAQAHYRRAVELQPPPRYTDTLDSIAQICELRKDWDGAIAAHREAIDILAKEWGTAQGEQVDWHRREIARLRENEQ